MARRRWPRIGTIVKIPFEDTHTFARVLESPYIAVYDARGMDAADLDAVVARPVVFFAGVYEDIIKKGEWPAVGERDVPDGELEVPDQFIQDPDFPEEISIISADGEIRPATVEEARGLEPQAIWDREHVEERLADHYAGRPNAILESMGLGAEARTNG